jgi:hypothetical protein
MRSALLGLLALWPVFLAAPAFAGEELPPGPPWQEDWRTAKRDAMRTGRPIFAYFTKKH